MKLSCHRYNMPYKAILQYILICMYGAVVTDMAERNLPWIPSPQSSRTEKTTPHHDDSRLVLTPLYSHVLTSHHIVEVSTDREDGREVLTDKPTVPPQTHKSPLISKTTTSPRNGHESPADISRNYERPGGFSGGPPPISMTNLSPDMHKDKVCDVLVPQPHIPIYQGASESVRVQEYRSKYVDLLKKERCEHEVVLERFDGIYTLTLLTNDVSDYNTTYNLHGYIRGMKDFQIELITQAVETEPKKGIELKTIETQATICRAFILRKKNYQSKDQKMYIAFDKDGNQKIMKHTRGAYEVRVYVHFHLKSLYFNTLEQTVQEVPVPVVQRIIANEITFVNMKPLHGLDLVLDISQMVALDTVLFHPQKYYPILISGPFGTGKTHVLAVAALLVFLRHNPAKVLVCTQQRESAENFFMALLSCMKYTSSDQMDKVSVHLLIEYGRQKQDLKPYYINVKDLSERVQSTKLLIVTTCITSRRISHSKIMFTHIMIDEGGLMREPEAVIPLCMANEKTTIVIAGDPQQVGPQSLVLDKEAKCCGLGESLLGRLLREYKYQGEVKKTYHVTLTLNYRCLPDIVSLLQPLFYPNTLLRCNRSQPVGFPFNSNLIFTCSSVRPEEKAKQGVNQKEAEVICHTLQTLSSKLTTSKPSIGIMAKFRNQLDAIGTCIEKRLPNLKTVSYITTYCMQGAEYSILFLSTTEPVMNDTDNITIEDSTKSLSNPYVFNTAISRARDCVIASGNPFILLKIEKVMEKEYPGNMAKCWSSFLKHCLEKGTVLFDSCLVINDAQKGVCLDLMRKGVEERLGVEVMMDQNLLQYIPRELPRLTKLEDDYTEVGVLGSGGYGIVLHVQRATDKRDFALKLIVSNMRDHEKTKEEASKLAILKHRNIVQYFNSGLGSIPACWDGWKEWTEKKKRSQRSTSGSSSSQRQADSESICLYILTEWCENGTLRDWLNHHMDTSKVRVRLTILGLFRQIIEALEYIHDNNLAHRDLKPSNIFFKNDDTLKIGDFGFVKEVGDPCAGGDTIMSESSASLSRYYGTEFYRSPEVRKKHHRSKIDWRKTDIYASGVIFFELCHIVPRQDRDKIFRKLLPLNDRILAEFPKDFEGQHCVEAVVIIEAMTRYDPSQRPSAKYILQGEELKSFTKKLKRKEKKRKS